MVYFGKPSEFHTTEVSIYRGGGLIISPVSRVFRVQLMFMDVGTETVDEDYVALYLGYDIWGLDTSKVDVVGLVVSPIW